MPFHLTLAPGAKLEPMTRKGPGISLVVTELGRNSVIVGVGFEPFMVKVRALAETPPPGGGLTTSTEAVPAAEILSAETKAESTS